MVHQRAFGRRALPQDPPRRAAPGTVAAARVPPPPATAETPFPETHDAAIRDDDRELQDWIKARKQRRVIPWRPLSLMASLCFGIASFVLPDTVNDKVQWLLYALMAASLYAGFKKRRQTR